jgi:hypothetical protein
MAIIVLVLLVPVGLGSRSLYALGPGFNGPVYTVAQLSDALTHTPDRVMGQALRVQGVLQSSVTWPCAFAGGSCASAETQLTGPEEAGHEAGPSVAVVLEPETPLAARLRRLVWISAIIPPAQEVRWDAPATYRVEVRHMPGSPAGFAVVIPDTAS